MNNQDIGWAVNMLRQGHRVCRAGWNGKRMYLKLIEQPGNDWSEGGGPHLTMQPFVAMKTAQGTLVPWLCSVSDLLATDWDFAEFGLDSPPKETTE